MVSLFLLPVAVARPSAISSVDRFTPLIPKIPSPPRWYKGDDGRRHLSYDLILTNGFPVGVRLSSVDVLTKKGRRIDSLSGGRLTAATSLVGSPGSTADSIGPAQSAVVYVDVARRRRFPREIANRMTVDVSPGLPVPSTISYVGGLARVAARRAVLIGPPVSGPRWVPIIGAHRRALQPVNGLFRNGQRFAIDWNRIDSTDRASAGDPSLQTSTQGYGDPVYAVGGARVIAAVDGIPDQDPTHFVPVPIEQADGNFVVLKLAPHTFAGYAHLVPGSVRVRRGERVHRGQVLGRLGNSGNSNGAHLHFQVMNAPSLLSSDGLPVLLSRFRVTGRVPSLDAFGESFLNQTPIQLLPGFPGVQRRVAPSDLEVLSLPRR